jgi:hypothetical protein
MIGIFQNRRVAGGGERAFIVDFQFVMCFLGFWNAFWPLNAIKKLNHHGRRA